MYVVGFVTACYSPGLLWAAGISQQLFVSHAGLQHLTKTSFENRGGGENKSIKKLGSISALLCMW